ncbi:MULTISPECIES: c-type cytochrome biogenesis protein CcsB [Brevibacterium]|uniref:C-type cytochrome biogenesis protein CcsB n=3 Tax=Bacteria TaxID=2 RepID=A0A165ECG2_9MICO|nr:c-type cytochrome biogenesis protein CcsB [Brevibacterium casei]KZE22476.1 cytochrome C biogenesis protein [Brevibacterium casei]MBE4695491.1 c-type cytochrome biogenesis protein CcsB [Brevibacterium casei]MBY3578613.1 c-type cytochrome biogenesis protein CcsB [Brevibacterium casei]MCT2184534.1 c-type cytochrome biogenesis protein CcsB [Brevibacterium casei]MCT2359562.1 c-type cytochrome biogenesis protein CcsB [Brevibacterium casei]
MDVNLDLAMWSNQLIVSAMVVYAVAMIFYAFDLFGGRELKRSEGATVAAKPSTVRRTNRRTATALLDRPGAGDDSGSGAASGGAEDLKGRARRGARIGTSLLVLAIILHVASVLTRTFSVMRVPWGNMMEYVLTATAITVIVYLIVLTRKDIRYLGTFLSGAVLLSLGLAITVFYTPAAQLIPALDSYWIAIHVPIAILSTALLSISAILAVFQILKTVSEDKDPKLLRFMRRLPSSTDLERTSYMLAAVGFITWTFTLIAGAIWAEVAWSRYWGWDTKEIWTFVVWVIYAAYLHARATRGWGPTKVAVLNLIGIASVIFNFTVVNVYFNGLHSYSGLG